MGNYCTENHGYILHSLTKFFFASFNLIIVSIVNGIFTRNANSEDEITLRLKYYASSNIWPITSFTETAEITELAIVPLTISDAPFDKNKTNISWIQDNAKLA